MQTILKEKFFFRKCIQRKAFLLKVLSLVHTTTSINSSRMKSSEEVNWICWCVFKCNYFVTYQLISPYILFKEKNGESFCLTFVNFKFFFVSGSRCQRRQVTITEKSSDCSDKNGKKVQNGEEDITKSYFENPIAIFCFIQKSFSFLCL